VILRDLPIQEFDHRVEQIVTLGQRVAFSLDISRQGGDSGVYDQGDLIIQVPAANVEMVGVRDVIDKKGVKQVFDVLRAEFVEEPTNWSRRYKANLEKLASGDVVKVSEVVRDLWRRDQDRGLSAGEKRMLAKARQILISELALARKVDEEKAGAELDKVLAS
jgi:CarD family transcriptional regulator